MKKQRWAFVAACILGIAQLMKLVDSVRYFFLPNTIGRHITNFLIGDISEMVLLVATGIATVSYVRNFREENLNERLIGAILLVPATSHWLFFAYFVISFAATEPR